MSRETIASAAALVCTMSLVAAMALGATDPHVSAGLCLLALAAGFVTVSLNDGE